MTGQDKGVLVRSFYISAKSRIRMKTSTGQRISRSKRIESVHADSIFLLRVNADKKIANAD
ncbi:hypothetical protein XI25_08965 [Paenibacillus sp. DMB20]|nr:hypothetical protein XI25_08965 [Paenibacillus sp. DMB20]